MHPPPLLIMQTSSGQPVIGAIVFVVIMPLVSEPARRSINAMIVQWRQRRLSEEAVWEVLFPVVALLIAIAGFARIHSSVSPG